MIQVFYDRGYTFPGRGPYHPRKNFVMSRVKGNTRRRDFLTQLFYYIGYVPSKVKKQDVVGQGDKQI